MTALTAGKKASAGIERAARYARHRPEQTLLYPIVQAHCPVFLAALASRDRSLPNYVQREFEDFLACGYLEHGFLRVRCVDSHAEPLIAFSGKCRGSPKLRRATHGRERRRQSCTAEQDTPTAARI